MRIAELQISEKPDNFRKEQGRCELLASAIPHKLHQIGGPALKPVRCIERACSLRRAKD